MKIQLTGILLLFCMALPVLTLVTWAPYRRARVRREVKHNLMGRTSREDLVLLKFSTESKKQLKWKHDKEFEYEGEMYDIVERDERADSSFYWCWWDHEETRLNKQVQRLASLAFSQDSQNQNNQKRLHKFLKSVYFAVLPKWLIFQPPTQKPEWNNHWQYASVQISPPVPPPEMA